MQSAPPVYRRPSAEDTAEMDELNEAFDRLYGRKKPTPRRKRVVSAEADALFDVGRWRLPARWRNDKRVGDAAIAKMTRGCDPARLEELTA